MPSQTQCVMCVAVTRIDIGSAVHVLPIYFITMLAVHFFTIEVRSVYELCGYA